MVPHSSSNQPGGDDLFAFPVVVAKFDSTAGASTPVVAAVSTTSTTSAAATIVASTANATEATARAATVGATPTHAMSADGQSASDTEDLFDFPIIEIPIEGDVAAASTTSAASAPATVRTTNTHGLSAATPNVNASAPVAVAQASPGATQSSLGASQAPTQTAQGSHAATQGFPAATLGSPGVTQVSPSAAQALRPAPAHAPVVPIAPAQAAASIGSAQGTKKQGNAVAETAARVAPTGTDPIAEESNAQGRSRRRLVNASSLWIAIAVIAAINVGGLGYMWHTRSTVGAGIETLREELDSTARRIEIERRQSATKDHAALAAATDPDSAPVGSIERASVDIAVQQLSSGEYASARMRLQRLLAQTDRMDRSVRDELEPRIVYLVAQSYFDEARVRRGVEQ